MVVNGPPKPTLGLDHLGGWGRLGIAVAAPAAPPLVYGALYFVGWWADQMMGATSGIETPGRFVAYPMMGVVVVFLGALAVRAVGAAVVEATKWIREGFEVDARRRALREPGTPGVGQVSLAEPVGGEVSLPPAEHGG
jgi:hypothetical protein